MHPQDHQLFPIKILFAHDCVDKLTAIGQAVRLLAEELRAVDSEVVIARDAEDATAVIRSDPGIQALLLDWELGSDKNHAAAMQVLRVLRECNAEMPVFLVSERESAASVPVEAMQLADDFIWLLEDTADFIAGRVIAAATRYRRDVLPPMFKALVEFSEVHEYSWHTPGHTGGTAFLRTPVGRAFFHYFGENLFRSDLSISVGELGSLLDHSGPIGESEKYTAGVFGAHRSYHVTNGSSMSNRVILMASVTRGQSALCDRNCHKSVEHAITMSGAIPTYLMPSRNQYGIIGPIKPENLKKEAVKKSLKANPLLGKGKDAEPVHAVITNSTYDGLCYNVKRVEELLGQNVDRLHFDEAWYGYARFNPIYKDRFAMHGDPADHGPDKPTVFATQSTHKLLAALSQASMIHIREGRSPIEHARFNEAYMMHASTSPCYTIIASNDVSAAMMDGPSGKMLTTATIREAVAFRQMMARMNSDFSDKKEWFFNCWQPDTVSPDGKKKGVAFHKADTEMLVTEPGCWVLKPGAPWHGFGDIEDGYCMLDPIKVSVVTPGVLPKGGLDKHGIPAALVTMYLDQQGIVVEKTTDFTILFLFSMGVTKGKWGTLVNTLLDFKRDYDANAPLKKALPSIAHHKAYAGMGLKDLANTMFAAMAELKTTATMAEGFSVLPVPDMSPVEAYEHLVRNKVESLTLKQMKGRTVATGVVPYPPGIPLLMPGENAGPADGPLLGYLKALEAYDSRFPGFGHDIHGVEPVDGEYRILCIKK